MKKIFSKLTFRVLAAITAGVLPGHFPPATAVKMRPPVTYFIKIARLFIYPIFFLTISLGLSGMVNLKKVVQAPALHLIIDPSVSKVIIYVCNALAKPVQDAFNQATARMAIFQAGDFSKGIFMLPQ